MSHLLRIGCFGLMILALGAWDTAEVAAKKKNPPKKEKGGVGDVASADDYKTIQFKKELSGTVVGVSGNTLMIRVDYPHYEPNPKYKAPNQNPNQKGNPKNPYPKGTNPQNNAQMQMMKVYADLMRQQQLAMSARTPQERQKAMMKFQQDMMKFQQQYAKMMVPMQKGGVGGKDIKGKDGQPMNNANSPFIVVNTSKNFELEIEDKAGLRKMYLPFEYDDVGNIKKYSDKEIAELKGKDKSLPGYTARMDEVSPGAQVRLTLTPVKAAKKEAKKKDDEDLLAGDVQRPTINNILLTKESPTSGLDAGAPAKKGKKK